TQELVAQNVQLILIEVIDGRLGGLEVMVLLNRLVDTAGRNCGRERLVDGSARVKAGFNIRHPNRHRDCKEAGDHHQGEYEEHAGSHQALEHARMVLCAQIEFENGQREQVIGEGHEGQERALKCSRIETDGALEDEKGQEKYYPVKPRTADNNEQPKGPAAVRSEIAS